MLLYDNKPLNSEYKWLRVSPDQERLNDFLLVHRDEPMHYFGDQELIDLFNYFVEKNIKQNTPLKYRPINLSFVGGKLRRPIELDLMTPFLMDETKYVFGDKFTGTIQFDGTTIRVLPKKKELNDEELSLLNIRMAMRI